MMCLCGAADCRQCHPENFDGHAYLIRECDLCGCDFRRVDREDEAVICVKCEIRHNAELSGGEAVHSDALLTAYAETCRHIEELERIQAGNKYMVSTCAAKKLADSLIERILALMPNAANEPRSE